MKMGPVFFLAALPAMATAAQAQTQTSVGVGVGTVRFAGGSSFSAVSFSPAAQVLAPSFFFGLSGSVAALRDGVWASQGRADFWAARDLALNAGIAGSTRSDGVASGAVYGIGELILARPRGGAALGAGVVAGAIADTAGVAAVRLRARGWWQRSRSAPQLSLSVEATAFPGGWYTDILAGATVDRPRLVVSLWATARVSAAYGSKGAASAALQYFATPTLAIEVGGGGYLSDPFQGLPRAGYVTGGVRLHRRAPAPALDSPPLPLPHARLAPLIANKRGDSVVVRFQMAGARSVAIAGDWNAWRPVELRALGGDFWEAALVLAPGTYHFSLLVDGTEWVVPGGVAVVPDGMGGLVALLTVP